MRSPAVVGAYNRARYFALPGFKKWKLTIFLLRPSLGKTNFPIIRFPGWLQRVKGVLRSRAPDYLNATNNYVANIGATIAKAQITNGGPVILLQPENEYSGYSGYVPGGFPDPVYFKYVEDQFRNAGIIVPFISNDAGKLY